MTWSLSFFAESFFSGAGLAMDAFSVSLANGLNEPKMKKRRMFTIAGVFALFQFLMPMLGWVCVHTVLQYFQNFEKFIPWIALVLLLFIGGKMLLEGLCQKEDEKECEKKAVCFATLIVQGIATSIDALSVGFVIAKYNLTMAIVSCLVIGAVTLAICLGGLVLGKKFGDKFADKAGILGGVILIIIGLEIFITGVF